MKAVTFSFDDGITQDQRVIEILDKYGLRGTFNLNSELLGTGRGLVRQEVTIAHVKPRACEIQNIYKNHEIAAHTLTHPSLPKCDDAEVIRQVEQDRQALSELAGYEVVGMAYPGGGVNHDDRVVELIKQHTGIKYARTVTHSYSFDLQEDLYRFKATASAIEFDRLHALAEEFLNAKPDKPMLFYIWGHSFEFDIDNSWSKFEDFCKLISGHDDIFYGTNREVFSL